MRHLFIVLFCIGYCIRLFGMDEIHFKHLGIREGLSDNQINDITKDSQGFMWFSTSYGLNRYDGYSVKTFVKSSKDPFSLPDNSINNVQEDQNGDLWIHTDQAGYVFYNSGKENFQLATVILKDRYGIAEKPDKIYVDRDRNLWCYSNLTGVHFFDREKGELTFFSASEEFKKQNIHIAHITEDNTGIIFLYENGYFEKKDPNTGQIIFGNDFLTRQSQNWQQTAYSMFVDSDGDYWFFSHNGLWIYFPKEDKWDCLSTRKESSYVLSSHFINDVKQDTKGQIWIATDHGGINLIDKKLHTVRYLQHDLLDERSIVQNSLYSLYCDDNETIWVGSYKRGVSFYNGSIFKFRTDHLSEFNKVLNFAADVNAITEDKNGNLWVGTNSSGLVYINRETGERKIYQHSSGRNSLSGNIIVSLLASRDGKIWAGTYLNGLNVFDGNRFLNYNHDPFNKNSPASTNIWALAEDSNGYIWIGTLGSGLQGFDPATGIFTGYAGTNSGFDNESILSICVSQDKDHLYMASSFGITIFSLSTGTFEKCTGNKKDTQRFSHHNMNHIYEDSRGLLWLATQEGLNIYDRKKDEIIIPTDDLLPRRENIKAIIEDDNKNMWITTASKIVHIIVHVDPTTSTYAYTYLHYSEQDGMRQQQFNHRAIAKTSRGEIVAGGTQGLTLFKPEHMKYNYYTPKVEFTGLQLFNNEVFIDSAYNGNLILPKALNKMSAIKLNHDQNVFSISFSAMNYILPEKTKYRYMLKGFNSDWLISDGNKVTYTNLTPGKYTFRVKAENSDGFSDNTVSELEIVITPPFWATPVAYVIYALLILGVLFLGHKLVLRNERQKYKLKQIEQEAMQKHEMDDMKLRFFTNISHELRTPLTLILSPLDNLMKSIDNKEHTKKLDMIHRNAVRLLTLVNQLLDFRKNDMKGHRLHMSQGDIVDFIRTTCSSFTEYSEKKHVHLTFFSSERNLFMLFDEDKVEKIITNLLSNAFNFTPENGRVDVSLTLLPAKEGTVDLLEVKIADTGIGIDDSDKEFIFERFYQIQSKENNKNSGSGIGLHLVKEFVILHGGTIRVLDNIEKGSVFIFHLPVASVQNTRTTDKKEENTSFVNSPEHIREDDEENSNDMRSPVILIVDDNEDFRQFMKDSLTDNYYVETASDGAKAWDIIPELQPDIIISDVMMPETDGNELCRLVKTDIRTSHIPFILLTVRSAKEHKLEGLESGADDYITKPFDFEILTLRIKKLLESQQTRQERFNKQIEIKPSQITITSLDEKLIQKAVLYVEKNLSRSELTVEELSKELGMSRVHLYKKLLSITGKKPIEFIRIIRLKRAAQYLRQSQKNVSEVAYLVGFNNLKFFRKYFLEEFGVLPSEYQEKKGRVD